VVTNVLADHLGSEGIHTLDQMATAKSEIARRTDPAGTIVLNADDPRVSAMAQVTRARPISFSIEGRENTFERGWFLRDGSLWRKDGTAEERILASTEMPMTYGGQQRFNVANALAALAAIEGISDRFPVTRAAQLTVLREYERDYRVYPVGRFILTRFRGHHVLLLHCKNPDAYRLEAPLIRHVQASLGHRSLVGVSCTIGNRTEEYHRLVSEQVARLCDGVFIVPPKPKFLRGMTFEEMTRRLSTALKPEQLLGTGALPVVEMLEQARQRFGESFLLAYFVTHLDSLLDLEEFLREAEVLPIPEAALEVRT
jgi:cyanophycin synthetase